MWAPFGMISRRRRGGGGGGALAGVTSPSLLFLPFLSPSRLASVSYTSLLPGLTLALGAADRPISGTGGGVPMVSCRESYLNFTQITWHYYALLGLLLGRP